MGHYETAQVCLNGHVITDTYISSPSLRQQFCSKCGKETIFQCPSCKANIQGDYRVDGVVSLGRRICPAPAYCHSCGKPYPWTESNLKTISDLLKLDEQLQEADIETMEEILPDLLTDTPKSKVAEAKYKIIMRKAGRATIEAVKEIIVEIASEAIKKSLYP
jgi:hypothetical protein